jgi:RNase adaptor protein for sRNA GlmZ degradation
LINPWNDERWKYKRIISLRNYEMYDFIIEQSWEIINTIINYILTGKRKINIYCHGGKQRSVAIAHYVYNKLKNE